MHNKFSFPTIPLVCLFFGAFANATIFGVIRDGSVENNFSIAPITLNQNGIIFTFAEQSDGKIMVGGSFTNISATATNNIARLNSDGSFDQSFLGRANNSVKGIFPLASGQFLISGDFLQYDGVTRNRIARINSDGSLDQAFNPNFGTDFVQIVAVQPGGKIIVYGTFTNVGGVTRIRFARLNSDGSLDSTFDSHGGLPNAGVDKCILLADGKILLSGRFNSYDGVPRHGIVRVNADGSLDTTFVPPTISDTGVEFFDMGLASDGKLYLVGDVVGESTIRRLNTDGSRDDTFNTGGASTADGGRIYTVVVQPDGKVLIGGEFDGFFINGGVNIHYRLFRFNPDGTVDSSFTAQAGNSLSSGNVRTLKLTNSGKVLIGGDFPFLNNSRRGGIGQINLDSSVDPNFVAFFGSFTTPNAFHIFPNGKILVAGDFDAIGTNFSHFVSLLNSDGTVDNSFQLDPRVDNLISAIAVQPDGNILLGGYTGDTFNRQLSKGLWRIHPDGSLDTTLDTQLDELTFVRQIAIQNDGKIVIGGDFSTVNGITRNRVARVNSNGSLDSTFSVALTSSTVYVTKILIQPDSKILLGGGFNTVNGNGIRGVVRLSQDGSVDPTFGIGTGANNTVDTIWLNTDGSIFVGGSFTSFNGSQRGSIVRLLSNGAFDPAFKNVRVRSDVASIVPLPNGKILIAGTVSSTNDASQRSNVVRLLKDGSVDFSFAFGAVTRNGSSAAISQMEQLPDGRIVALGSFDRANGVSSLGLVILKSFFSRISPPVFDYDGDGRSDLSVFRPSTGVWYRLNSDQNQVRIVPFGLSGDLTVKGDFDGDFRTDVAVFRPSSGEWYIINSSDDSVSIYQFGVNGDIPVAGDYDGDGKTDIAQYRPSDGNWYIFRSSDGGVDVVHWGLSTDIPVPADYDGDGHTDIAVFRPQTGQWYILQSVRGTFIGSWGVTGDIPCPGDFDGDGKADLGIYRPSDGTWYVYNMETSVVSIQQWGISGDVPVPADYGGDSRMDAAIYRNGTWYVLRSAAGVMIAQWGLTGDSPIPLRSANP